MMTKSDTIDAIQSLNPTASRMFLAEFSKAELTEYLQRLDRRSEASLCAIGPSCDDTEAAPCLLLTADS